MKKILAALFAGFSRFCLSERSYSKSPTAAMLIASSPGLRAKTPEELDDKIIEMMSEQNWEMLKNLKMN